MSELPSRLLRSSDTLGWRQVHASTWRDPPVAEEFRRAPTPDLTVVLVTSGSYRIESRGGGSWRGAAYRPGSVGITAPGRGVRLRWRAAGPQPMESLHLRLGAGLVGETLSAYGRTPADLPDALTDTDDYVAAAAATLAQALREGAPALYADAVAQGLVAHLVHRSVPVTRPPAVASLDTGRVIEHMHAHLSDDVDLDALAAVAAMSKFHFVRAFRAATGLTPHRYLTTLRMRRAADLLRTTGLSIRQVASACGYQSPSRFAATFRREHGTTPADYRKLGLR
ncbi:helix-turn-helix transcriptional regulator [Actinoplanes sp. TRM 88003]|uniref:Helix-turn-helix transcriptional regulator n=1 Tax=Paractinoplanes aksuensis TaxID=2939490 RepID=A0ABT1DHP1_9ACTN|nr:helix-turn-helix transcriptional regulator [Actinoplanes aksuensis]MCO8270354.1 helix-turn-helix transcriptional regulator [Actinoplanes aksuensis]